MHGMGLEQTQLTVRPRKARSQGLYERIGIVVLLFLADLTTVTAAGVGAYATWGVAGASLVHEVYYPLLLALPIFPLAFLVAGLYPGYGLGPVEVMRRYAWSLTFVYLLLGTATFLFKVGPMYSRGVLLLAWLTSILVVPPAALGLRYLLSRLSWWGEKTVVLGGGLTGTLLVKELVSHPEFGLVPVAVLDDNPKLWGKTLHGVPVLAGLDLCQTLLRERRVNHAIVAMPGVEWRRVSEIIDDHGRHFHRVSVVPDLFEVPSLWVAARDLNGMLLLQMRRNLLRRELQLAKRVVDVLGAGILLALFAPAMAVIALLIWAESGRPILYGHRRIGHGGATFTAWKFRTMVRNADEVLRAHLEADPALRKEWEENHKLKHDPRVTRVGRFLRRTSLDELPQLYNVIRGEMSLVGPRPIVAEEIPKYNRAFELYLQVRPGMTGLWQVSGRNDTSYEERVRLDSYYIRNWSLWLDMYILLKTVGVVLRGSGAY